MGDLYWGDNLTILREHIADASVDLVYLDPPFNSNVLFRDQGRAESDARIEAFTDTWHWSESAEETYRYLPGDSAVPQRVSDLVVAMRSCIGANDVMAYLVMMTVRLLELHRVLKPTGSMRAEGVAVGTYRSELMGRDYPRLQLLTIGDLLHKREPQLPPRYNPYRLAEFRGRLAQQPTLFDVERIG